MEPSDDNARDLIAAILLDGLGPRAAPRAPQLEPYRVLAEAGVARLLLRLGLELLDDEAEEERR